MLKHIRDILFANDLFNDDDNDDMNVISLANRSSQPTALGFTHSQLFFPLGFNLTSFFGSVL